MSSPIRIRRILAAALAIAATGLVSVRHAGAELADLSTVPLANSPSDAVLPNLMYILDDSGSMAWNYMPDQIFRTSGGSTLYNCKKCTSSNCGTSSTNTGPGGTSSTTGSMTCANTGDPDTVSTTNPPDYGEAPFYSGDFNKIWYNPDITYGPGLDSTGTSLGNANPNNAKDDAYLSSGNSNLVSGFKEVVYCNVSSPNGSDLTNPAKCRKNGIHNVTPFAGTTNYFLYWGASGANVGFPTKDYWNKTLITSSNAHYFNITPHEYCSDASLVNCALALASGAAPASPNTIPAPLRWCRTAADAVLTTVVSGNSGGNPRCQKKFVIGTYRFPRYGRFQRVDIVSSTGSYPKAATSVRTDCASATSCTYAEEIQNYANWWTYYSNRMSLMKTSTGRAFLPIDDRFRIGFITINPNSPVTATKYQEIAKFDSVQKLAFYTKLYAQSTNGSTPNRTALDRVGRHYSGQTNGVNSGMPNDPIQYSCQQNFTLLTTDGYWNDSFTGVGNEDNSNSGYTTRAYGAYDGGLTGASNTLGDVAAYYYKTDLRTSGPVSDNNVPTSEKDPNPAQHMVTFTLGLGLEGLMDYRPDYESALTGDFAQIKAGTNNACSWTTGTCNWPVPASNAPSTLDDLWHAAVNGRGKYFSANDPNSLTQGLQSALSALRIQTAAAAASATSSPNITETDNFIYSSTFRTVKWDGEIVAQRIDTTSGNVLPAIAWSAQALLDGRTAAGSDTRDIFTIDESAGGKRKPFNYANLTNAAVGSIAAERAYFDNKCTAFSQCALLTAAQKAVANDGSRLVSYLRGWRQDESFSLPESNPPFRAREHILGDPINATPAFMKTPRFGFADAVTPTYADFKLANAGRQATLFIAANDGMLHALNGDTGSEMWAYVPRMVMPKLHKLATENWSVVHEFNVDGSPQMMDAYFAGGWKTVLVSGLNSGGRGYYALDVTVPGSPTVLWEICSDPTLCAISDPDIGFTHANPVVTKRASDGKWVVLLTSGLNNVLPGTGRGYLYVVDIATGTILQKIDTGAGNTTTPSGFNHLSAYADNFNVDNTAKFVYGGDLYGNVWKFDLQTATPTKTLLATLKDATGKPQSITSRPELGLIDGFPIVFVGTGRYLGTDDLVDPATLVPPNQWAYEQSFYAIKDQGTSYGNFRLGNVVENLIVASGPTSRTTTNNAVDWAVQDGWYIDFNPGGDSPGERVNLDPQLVQGTIIIVTNVPNNSACAVGGDSWIYQLNYKSGAFVLTSPLEQAGQKFTGQITVGLVVVRLPSGKIIGIATGATGAKTTVPVPPPVGGGNARRISWRELMQR
ncbi:MAG TPA: PilC/PilY family type IV pilus protein [Usitatibacteraceae bacterium]|nr:PilC/PilY family type IV pilus protein [Usitatibacteraceae bacterium]